MEWNGWGYHGGMIEVLGKYWAIGVVITEM